MSPGSAIPGDEDHELVAARPADEIDSANAGLEAPRDLAQHFVAGTVSERVVDRLEAVEVEEQDREAPAVGLRSRDRIRQPLFEREAVRQAGQPVVVRRLE